MSTKKRALSGSAKPGAKAKPGASAKAGPNSKGGRSAVSKIRSSLTPGKIETAIRKNVKDMSTKLESMVPPGSPERVAAGVAAVTGGALIAGATLGAGPAALAGAAGYLAYKGLSDSDKKKSQAGSATRKRKT
jgi:hypothetical protein